MSVIYRELWFVVDNDSHHQSSVSDLLHFPQWEYSHWYHSWRIRLGDTVAGRISPLCFCWLGENFGSSYRAEGETSICESVISHKTPSQPNLWGITTNIHIFVLDHLMQVKYMEFDWQIASFPYSSIIQVTFLVWFVRQFSVFSSSNNHPSYSDIQTISSKEVLQSWLYTHTIRE